VVACRGKASIRRIRSSEPGKIAALLFVALAACGGKGHLTPTAPPPPAATREERWIQDVDYLASELPRLHPNLFFQTPRGEFDAVVASERATAATARDHEVVAGLMRIAAVARDAHTTVYPWRGFRFLPLSLTRLADGLYVTEASAPFGAALGLRVVAIGSVEAAALEARAAPFGSYENEAWLRLKAAQLLAIPEMLHVLGATSDPAAATFRLEAPDGTRVELDLSALTTPPQLVDLTTASGAPLPLHQQRTGENYWLTLVEESRTLYLQYRRCQNGSEPFSSVADRAFGLMDRGAADRLVADVRHNGGGDSRVDDRLIEGLQSRSAWRQRGRLYCLIGSGTFSSGVMTADDLRKLGAVLVGSPTGGKPNSYGNTSTLQLPNSLLQVSYSTRYFQLFNGSDPPWLAPELAVDETIADLRAGRDPLLEAAVADHR
jgi:hypothetical protein